MDEVHVEVVCRASMEEIAALGPERAAAFMAGVAAVLVAANGEDRQTHNRDSVGSSAATSDLGQSEGEPTSGPVCHQHQCVVEGR